MSSTTPFRFAAQAFNAGSATEWREIARQAEGLGYSALHVADHYFGPGPLQEETGHPVQELAAVPAMMMAAEATETIRVGSRVLCVDYHLPAVLAKEAATLDLLSDGRFELGLGAGWLAAEYRAMGLDFDPIGVRIDRLAEVVRVVKAQFSGEPIDVRGDHVSVAEYTGAPVPARSGGPPIMIGGGGRRILGLAGREADIVSLNFNNRAGVIGPEGVQLSTAEETDRKIGWIRDGAGARFDELELEIAGYFAFVTDHGAATCEALGPAFGLTPEQMRDHPNALIGSVDEICETLVARRERYGISYVTVLVDAIVPDASDIATFAPVVERLHGH